jgi:hypothetical protein
MFIAAEHTGEGKQSRGHREVFRTSAWFQPIGLSEAGGHWGEKEQRN